MKTLLLKTGILTAFCLLLANPAISATLSFDFNLPATGNSSLKPPYPTVATLSVTDVAGGVQMTLTPNWSSVGWDKTKNPSIKSLEIVMPNMETSYTHISGITQKSFSLNNGENMDSGYKSTASSFLIDFKNEEFVPNNDSIWKISGVNTSSFTGLSASANNKPSSIFGIISVDSYSLEGMNPTPSNWVAKAPAVPLPAAVYLFGSALLGMVGIGYRRRPKAPEGNGLI